jgi:SAM-dependent methyltransferase
MALKHVQQTYDALGAEDPLYAVLSFPGKQGNRWDPEVFFQRGENEIRQVLADLQERGVSLQRNHALDFGCGVGRLSQALANHFEQVDGVDISHTMVKAANDFNRHGDRCTYHVNTAPDLSLFPDERFDFIYSNITLQHIPPEASEAYIRDFFRVLKPGGVALFQVPSGRRRSSNRLAVAWYRFRSGTLRRTWKRLRGKPPVEIHSVHRERVLEIIQTSGGRLLDSWREGSVRRKRTSWFYLVTTATPVVTS